MQVRPRSSRIQRISRHPGPKRPQNRRGRPPIPRSRVLRTQPVRRNSSRSLLLGLIGGISAGILIGLAALLLRSPSEESMETPESVVKYRRPIPHRTKKTLRETPLKEKIVLPVKVEIPTPLPEPEEEEAWEEPEDESEEWEEEEEEEEREESSPEKKSWTIVSSRSPEESKYAPGQLSLREKNKLFRMLKKDHPEPFRQATENLRGEHQIYKVSTLLDNGDPSRRLDIVILSAGFPEKAEKAFNRLAEKLKKTLLREDPFRNYAKYINVHRVNVDDRSMTKTQAEARVSGSSLTCNRDRAKTLASFAPDADLVVVLCDIAGVRATGGSGVITINADIDMDQTFLHEMGHAFGNLSDEYVDHSQVNGKPLFKDETNEHFANVTRTRNPKEVKWHYWTSRTWPNAHQTHRRSPDQYVSCFEGGYYRARGVWRPQEECLMGNGEKYCAVCFEQVERKFYEEIAPISRATPHAPKVALWKDESIEFEAELIQTRASGRSIGKFTGLWYVDGKQRNATKKRGLITTAKIRAKELGEGAHEVALRVDFSNKRIRRDLGWLSSSRGWSVKISPFPKPAFKGPRKTEGFVGKELTFEISIENPAPEEFNLEVHELPEGATFENGTFRWTPEASDQGAWKPLFRLTNGTHSVSQEVALRVKKDNSRSFPPIFTTTKLPSLVEGEEFEWTPGIIDLDGDHLVFTSTNLPEGAQLDRYTGRINWVPGARSEKLAITVTDGRQSVTQVVPLYVKRTGDEGIRGFGILGKLRAKDAKTRKATIWKLVTYSDSFQLLEAARLLRDRDESVRTAALGLLDSLIEKEIPNLKEMMIRDITPHVWHFTENVLILDWLETLAKEVGSRCTESSKLRRDIRKIRSYNSRRGVSN